LEDNMFTETKSNLLCHQIKQQVFDQVPYEKIDAYIQMFTRVQKFFKDTKTDNEVDALRTAFYLKVGTQITAEELERGSTHWKKEVLIKMIKEWDWPAFKVEQLNGYIGWQMMQKVALGNRVNKILMSSYKNISEKNSTLDPSESLITEKDTHLLGRKLFSFYRTAPNKVENLFALVDGKTAEEELTFLYEAGKTRDQRGEWYLVRGRTRSYIEQVDPDFIIKKSATLPFLIAFTAYNNLYNPKTNLLLRAEGSSIREDDLGHLLDQLSTFIAAVNIAAISNEDLMDDAQVRQLYLIIDFGNPPPMEVTMGNIRDCKTNDELNQFINKRLERIQSLSAIYMTTWGELFSKTYSGLNCMGRALSELSPQMVLKRMETPNFLKYYVPCGRKEILQIPWLGNYILRSLKIRSMAFTEQEAS
ncbi:MAG: class I adenylate cyclase, partial [Nitrospinae bacterium]|nr:class I adenylate cyclase [Nitrospinota bacterium]